MKPWILCSVMSWSIEKGVSCSFDRLNIERDRHSLAFLQMWVSTAGHQRYRFFVGVGPFQLGMEGTVF